MHTEGPARIVIVGGGVAALEAMLALRSLAAHRVKVTLIAPVRDFVYRPLTVLEPFSSRRPPRFDLAAICNEAGAEYVSDALASARPGEHMIVTRLGREIEYDGLLIACGSRMREGVPGAITFWGSADRPVFEAMLAELESGEVRDVAFVLPRGPSWALPLYELALLTATHLRKRAVEGATITVVTPESAPLEVFGVQASHRVEELLREHGVALHPRARVSKVEDGHLLLVPGERIAVDRVVALPRAEGPRIPGLPHDDDGFIPVDLHGSIPRVDDVYAAGDVTSFPVKQGGLATQQADTVAELIAARVGAPVRPRPFRPVMRGLLLTGSVPSFLRGDAAGGRGETSVASTDPLWWPPAKIAGHYLAPYLSWLSGDHQSGIPAASSG